MGLTMGASLVSFIELIIFALELLAIMMRWGM